MKNGYCGIFAVKGKTDASRPGTTMTPKTLTSLLLCFWLAAPALAQDEVGS